MRWITGALLVLVLVAGPASAETYRNKDGDTACYIPDGLASSAVVPVLLVEGGQANSVVELWPILSKRMDLIVVESYGLARKLLGGAGPAALRAEIDRALDFAEDYHPVWKCPKVLLGYAGAGPAILNLAVSDPEAWAGVLLVNARVDIATLPPILPDAGELKIFILHGEHEPRYPAAQARELGRHLEQAGITVRFEARGRSAHGELLGEVGAGPIVRFLKSVSPGKPGTTKVTTSTAGGLTLTADIYQTGDKSDPILLLFHQARSSRGEYAKIAPRLMKAGYNCLAIDQRSGKAWNGVPNETAMRALAAELPTGYADAKPDLERAISWAREMGFTGKLAVWGSSYSAALVFLVGQGEEVDAVVAFSPGDYLAPTGSVLTGARTLTKPVLIVCPPGEEPQATQVLDAVKSSEKSLFVQPEGVHGSSTLYRTDTAEQAWKKVLEFLATTLK